MPPSECPRQLIFICYQIFVKEQKKKVGVLLKLGKNPIQIKINEFQF